MHVYHDHEIEIDVAKKNSNQVNINESPFYVKLES
jgi:hypothetical protein